MSRRDANYFINWARRFNAERMDFIVAMKSHLELGRLTKGSARKALIIAGFSFDTIRHILEEEDL